MAAGEAGGMFYTPFQEVKEASLPCTLLLNITYFDAA